MNIKFLVFATACAIVGTQMAPPRASEISECDRLAASPLDSTRPLGVFGVELNNVDAGNAVLACRAVLKQQPDDPRILFQLGRALERTGNRLADEEAVKVYRKSAIMGHAGGQFNLGMLLGLGRGAPKDDGEAVLWIRKAAEQGPPTAQLELAKRYYDGRGVDQSYVEAMTWFLKAADQGQPAAQLAIGNLYYDGYGVTRDYIKSMFWFRKAADQGLPAAQYNVGLLYTLGLGIQQDRKIALIWFRKAAAGGEDLAKGAVEEFDRCSDHC